MPLHRAPKTISDSVLISGFSYLGEFFSSPASPTGRLPFFDFEFESEFTSPSDQDRAKITVSMMNESVEEIYSQQSVLDYYTKIVGLGLYPFEEEAIGLTRSSTEITREVLVVGCGAGREVFQIAKKSNNITGLDASQEMILRARGFAHQIPGIDFVCSSFENYVPQKKFELIWLTIGITGHIENENHRVDFLSKARRLLRTNGHIVFLPDISPGSPKLRNHFGGKVPLAKAYPYHTYRNSAEVRNEITSSGLSIQSSSPEFYILTHSSQTT